MKLSDVRFLFVLCLVFFAIAYTAAYPWHAFYGDENSYLSLGQQILEGGYSSGMADRGPMLPLIVSASYALGLDPFQARFIIPLITGLLFLTSVFLASRRFCRRPLIPVLIVLSFPFFWQWAPFLLVDVLLGIFSMLSVLYLYRAARDDRRYLIHSLLFLALAITTKASAVILIPAFLLYLALDRRLHVLKSRHLLKGLALFLVILIPAVVLTFLSSGTLGLNTRFMTFSYLRIPYYYILNFAMVPWSLLFLYGLYRTLRDRKHDERSYIFSLLIFLVVFVFFNLLVWKEMRFIIFAVPLFAVVAERGIPSLRGKGLYALVSVFFVLGLALSFLLLGSVSYVSWGQDTHTREMLALAPASIAYDAGYIYNKGLEGYAIEMPVNATEEWVRESGADYLSLSLYGELRRGPDLNYYKPMLGPLDISFLETGTPKAILTWWPGYSFSSPLYQWADSNLPVHKTIQYKGQDVFIIYRLTEAT